MKSKLQFEINGEKQEIIDMISEVREKIEMIDVSKAGESEIMEGVELADRHQELIIQLGRMVYRDVMKLPF